MQQIRELSLSDLEVVAGGQSGPEVEPGAYEPPMTPGEPPLVPVKPPVLLKP